MSPLRKPYFHQNMPYTLQNRDILCSCGKSSYQIGRFECHSSLIYNKILVDFCIVYSLLCHFWYLFCPQFSGIVHHGLLTQQLLSLKAAAFMLPSVMASCRCSLFSAANIVFWGRSLLFEPLFSWIILLNITLNLIIFYQKFFMLILFKLMQYSVWLHQWMRP